MATLIAALAVAVVFGVYWYFVLRSTPVLAGSGVFVWKDKIVTLTSRRDSGQGGAMRRSYVTILDRTSGSLVRRTRVFGNLETLGVIGSSLWFRTEERSLLCIELASGDTRVDPKKLGELIPGMKGLTVETARVDDSRVHVMASDAKRYVIASDTLAVATEAADVKESKPAPPVEHFALNQDEPGVEKFSLVYDGKRIADDQTFLKSRILAQGPSLAVVQRSRTLDYESDFEIVGISATGTTSWTLAYKSFAESGTPSEGKVMFADLRDDIVLVHKITRGHIVVVNATSGQVLWQKAC